MLRTTSGDIPIVHAPASIRRIVGLAYILIWTWREHEIAARLQKRQPLQPLVLLLDEVETHLHPQWQRRIVPAISRITEGLGKDIQMQDLLTTHSPLALASLEPHFDEQMDRIFHLDLIHGAAHLHEQHWAKQGDVINWLVSESFGP